MALNKTARWKPTNQERLDMEEELFLLCLSCGRLSKRILAHTKCPYCPSKKVLFVALEIVEQLT